MIYYIYHIQHHILQKYNLLYIHTINLILLLLKLALLAHLAILAPTDLMSVMALIEPRISLPPAPNADYLALVLLSLSLRSRWTWL